MNSRHQSAADQSRRPQVWSRLPVPSTAMGRPSMETVPVQRPDCSTWCAPSGRSDSRTSSGSARVKSMAGVAGVKRRSTVTATSRGAISAGTGGGGKAPRCAATRPS